MPCRLRVTTLPSSARVRKAVRARLAWDLVLDGNFDVLGEVLALDAGR
jgi:hypothetical protein